MPPEEPEKDTEALTNGELSAPGEAEGRESQETDTKAESQKPEVESRDVSQEKTEEEKAEGQEKAEEEKAESQEKTEEEKAEGQEKTEEEKAEGQEKAKEEKAEEEKAENSVEPTRMELEKTVESSMNIEGKLEVVTSVKVVSSSPTPNSDAQEGERRESVAASEVKIKGEASAWTVTLVRENTTATSDSSDDEGIASSPSLINYGCAIYIV